RRTASSYDRFRAATDAHDVLMQTAGIDPEVVRPALELPQVATWSEASFFIGGAGTAHDFGVIASRDDRFGATVDRPRVLEGRLPAPESESELVITEQTAEETGVGVGGTIRFETLSPSQIATVEEDFSGSYEGPTVPLRVVGLVRTPDDLQGTDDIGGYASPAFERRYRSTAGSFGGFYTVRLKGGQADVDAFSAGVAELLPDDQEWGIEAADDGATLVRDTLRVLTIGLVLFAVCCGVFGAVGAGQALGRHVSLRRDDSPTLAGVGMVRRQRAGSLLVPGMAVALAGSLMAVVVAVAASPRFPVGLARQAEPDPGVSVDVPVLAAGATTIVLLIGLQALFSAWSASRRAGAGDEATTTPSTVSALVARAGVGPSAVAGLRMAFEPGHGRTRVPVRSALAGTVVGVVGVVGALTFASSLDRLVDTPARWGWNWDLVPDVFPGDLDRFAADPDIAEVGQVVHTFVQVEGEGLQGFAVEPRKGTPQLAVLDGRRPADAGEVVLGRDLLGRLDKQVGDSVALSPSSGRQDEPLLYEVVGTAVFPTFETEAFAGGVGFTPEGLERVGLGEPSRRTILTFRRGVDETAAVERLTEAYDDRFPVYARPNRPGDVANLAQVDRLPWLLAGFLAVLALAVVAHALLVGVRRRRRDLAVLRAVGFRGGQTRAAVAWHATSLALVGVVVGLPLGVALGRWAWTLVATALGVLDDPSIPVGALLVVPIAALGVANAAAALPAHRAATLSPAAVLRTE
ncbi:MAG TPA: FtsX-like permease family protein, partial [Acidimicrobiales bacterium]|nr:FtsX-like permease family protein [Acidimicrobiales bacterium]